MDPPSAPLQDLATRLLALEKSQATGLDSRAHPADLVCRKLQGSLTRFAGSEGFTSLLRRALALARAQFPTLQQVTLAADGSLQGLEAISDDAGDAAVAIVAQLLGLLETFIGEGLTLRLVREAWPEESF